MTHIYKEIYFKIHTNDFSCKQTKDTTKISFKGNYAILMNVEGKFF